MFYALLYAIASPREDGYNIIIKCGQIFPRLHRALEFCGLIMLRVDVLVVVVVVVVVLVVVVFCFYCIWCNFFFVKIYIIEPVRSNADRITVCYALAHDILFSANDKVRLRDSYNLLCDIAVNYIRSRWCRNIQTFIVYLIVINLKSNIIKIVYNILYCQY